MTQEKKHTSKHVVKKISNNQYYKTNIVVWLLCLIVNFFMCFSLPVKTFKYYLIKKVIKRHRTCKTSINHTKAKKPIFDRRNQISATPSCSEIVWIVKSYTKCNFSYIWISLLSIYIWDIHYFFMHYHYLYTV